MKKISLQWRITLMTAILIGITCVSMNSLIGYSGRHYMDSIGSGISANSDSYKGEQEFFDPESADLDQEVTIIVNGAQESFSTTNWCITAVVTLLGGVLACFVSGRALKPLHTFASRVENVQPNNLPDMKITDDVPAEFKQFSISLIRCLTDLTRGSRHNGSSPAMPHTNCAPLLHCFRHNLNFFLLSILIWMPKVPTSSNYCRNKQSECRRLQRPCLK